MLTFICSVLFQGHFICIVEYLRKKSLFLNPIFLPGPKPCTVSQAHNLTPCILPAETNSFCLDSVLISCLATELSSGGSSFWSEAVGLQAKRSPTSVAEVNRWSRISTPLYFGKALCLIRHRDVSTFTFYISFTNAVASVLQGAVRQQNQGPSGRHIPRFIITSAAVSITHVHGASTPLFPFSVLSLSL